MSKFQIYGKTSYDTTLSNPNLGEAYWEALRRAGVSEDSEGIRQQKFPNKKKNNKHHKSDDEDVADKKQPKQKKKEKKKKKEETNDVNSVTTDNIPSPQTVVAPQQKVTSPQTQPQPNRPSKSSVNSQTIKKYQNMPIFQKIAYKGKVSGKDAETLALLADQLKKHHPELSAEAVLQNQVELYLAIQKEFRKNAKNLKTDKDATLEKINQFRETKYAELIQHPIERDIDDTIYDIYSHLYDFHMTLPKGLSRENYEKMINSHGTEVFLKKQKSRNYLFTKAWEEESNNYAPTTFLLNFNLDNDTLADLSDFVKKYPCLCELPMDIKDGYIIADNVRIFLLNRSDFEAQKNKLIALAKKTSS